MNIADSYLIGIKLDVTGDAHKKFSELSKTLDLINDKIKITTNLFRDFNKIFSKTDTLFTSFSSSLTGMDTELASVSSAMGRLTAQTSALNREMLQSKRINEESSVGSGGGGRGHSKTGAFMHGAEAGRLGQMATGGFGMAAAMGAGFILKSSFESQAHMQAQIMALKGIGFGDKFVNSAISDSMSQHIAGVSNLQYLTAVQEGAAVSRDPKAALALAPWLAKQTFANKNLYTTEGRKFTDVDQLNIVRFAEYLRPGHDPNKIKEGMDIAQQMWSAEGGKIRSYDLYGFARRYAIGMPMLSDRGLFEMVPIIQRVGGSMLGGQLRVLNSLFLRGQNMRTGKKATMEMMHLGLLDENKRMKDYSLWQQSPADWVNQFYIPHLMKHGITSKADILKVTSQILPGVSGNAISQIYLNKQQELEAAATGKHAFTTQGAFDASQKLNTAAMGRVSASWEKFSTAMGKLTSPSIVFGLDLITSALNKLTSVLTAITPSFQKYESVASAVISSQYALAKNSVSGLSSTVSGAAHSVSSFFSSHFANSIKTSPSTSSNDTHVTFTVNGDTLAKGTIKQMNKMANRPMQSGNAIHPNFALIPAGLNFSGAR